MVSPAEAAIPSPALVVLIGASASGKSTWAEEHFRPGQVLSSDHFRALVGAGPDDQTAGTDAFALLDQLVGTRLAKGLTTVVDTLGLDDDLRASLRSAAAEVGLPCVAVGFDTEPRRCHDRNQQRDHPVPKSVLDKQLRRWRTVRDGLDDEGFDLVLIDPGPARLVAESLRSVTGTAGATAGGTEASSEPDGQGPTADTGFQFDLLVSSFQFGGDNDAIGPTLVELARAAEEVGFRSVQVMDHFRQVPQVGRAWDPMLESFTTLAFVAGHTTRLRLGTLVAGIEHRNVGLLAKIVASLDVLSGGRVDCGLGAGWFDAEQAAFGYPVNSNKVRLDTLEEALQALPILWGPGSKSFDGQHVSIPEALAYPRPLQDPVPILVGGGGERRTLRMAARYASAANVQGDPATVAHKVEVLRGHAIDAGRDPDEVAMTVLSPLVHARTGRQLAELVETLRPRNRSAEAFAAANRAGTTDDQVAWFRAMAEAGATRASVALTGNTGPDRVGEFGEVIERFQ
ncbi:MAG: TIGR03560 family F420-dependent LLM class oxidoreductase [Actinomycetota bacterium]